MGSYYWDGSLVFINKSKNKFYRFESKDVKIYNSWTNVSEF